MLSPSEMYDTPLPILNENLRSERTKLPPGAIAIHSVDARSGEVIAGSDDSVAG